MTPALAIGLYWAGVAGAAVALVVYFVSIAIRPRWVRLINGAGLFFTGLGLGEAALSLRALGPMRPEATNAAFGICVLLVAVYFQSVAALRGRRPWDGTERRAGGGASA